MPHNRAIAVLSLLLLSASLARADGKFYSSEPVPPGVPYQRALLMYDYGTETLILQSKFRTSGKPEPGAALGWVVPVPAVPELDSIDAEAASSIFRYLDSYSEPHEIQIPTIPLAVFLAGLSLLLVLHFRFRGIIDRLILLLSVLNLGMVIYIVTWFVPTTYPLGIDILDDKEIGIYRAQVVKTDNSSDLVAWLNENGFHFQPADQPVLDDYIKRGWRFIVAKVKPGEEKNALDTHEGLADPLVLRFATKVPVYPLALTGTTGASTEVLLYVLARTKMQCSKNLELRYAHTLPFHSELSNRAMIKTLKLNLRHDVLNNDVLTLHLCKFKGTLTPAQMASDLELAPAADNEPYRERIVRWN